MKKVIMLLISLNCWVAVYSQDVSARIDSLVDAANKQIASKQYDLANKTCDELLRLYDGPEAHLLKAISLMEGRRFFSADVEVYELSSYHLDKAIERDSTYRWAYGRLGMLNLIYSNFDLAIENYSTYISYCTDSTELFNGYTDRGSAKSMKGDFNGAIEDYYLAKKIYPTHFSIYQNLGAILIDVGRLEEAEVLLLEGHTFYPEDDGILNNLGFLKIRQEKFPEAIGYFDAAIKSNPSDYLAIGNRGYCKLRSGDLKGAEEDMIKAELLYGENAYLYKYFALLYIEKGNNKKTCEMLNRANELGYSKIYDNEVNALIEKHCEK